MVKKLLVLKSRVVGIEYILDQQAPRQEKLAQAIKESVKKQNTWLAFPGEKTIFLRFY